MRQKDKVEKLLEDYPDVFADIINVLIYDGKQVISPKQLSETKVRSQYKAADSTLHEQERDILKVWKKGKTSTRDTNYDRQSHAGFTTAGSCPDSRNNSRQGFLWIPAKQMCTRCNGIYVQTPVKKNFSGMDFGR